MLKAANLNFYIAYKSARNIIDLGEVHTRLKVKVRNKQGNPLAGAKVSLFQNLEAMYTEVTDDEGVISITRVKPGIYNLVVEKDGCKNFTEAEINFRSGKKISRSPVLAFTFIGAA